MVAPDSETIRLSRQLAEAVDAGDRDDALRLTRLLASRLAKYDSDDREQEPVDASSRSVVPLRNKPQPTGSARQAITAALAEIGVPCRSRLVGDYAFARFGLRIESRDFSGFRRDERRAWEKGSVRPTYVVPAREGRFYQPIRGLLALSDRPLERRLVGPWSERADHLAATAQLARQLAWLNDRDPDVAKRLAPVVVSMAQSIPGAIEGASLDTARVELAAESERAALADRDEPWRRQAAGRAREQLTDEQQVWGTTFGIVAEGGRRP